MESYSSQKLKDLAGIDTVFVQDNIAISKKGVFRGLHFQNPPFAQAKLVKVNFGKVLDVILDVRVGSPTYGQWEMVELSDENHRMLYVPVGFAHGFLSLTENSVFTYKMSDFYHPEVDGGVLFSDRDLDIKLPISDIILSDKDKVLPLFKDFKSQFKYE